MYCDCSHAHHVVHYTKISISYLVAIPHRVSHTSSKNLVTVAQDNSTNPTTEVLVEDQIQPPLDLVTVSQE